MANIFTEELKKRILTEGFVSYDEINFRQDGPFFFIQIRHKGELLVERKLRADLSNGCKVSIEGLCGTLPIVPYETHLSGLEG